MKVIDLNFLSCLLEDAKRKPLHRVSHPIGSLSYFFALLPLSPVPVHKSENFLSILIFIGKANVIIYNDMGAIIAKKTLDPTQKSFGVNLCPNQWFTIEVTEPCVLYLSGEPELDKIAPENIMY